MRLEFNLTSLRTVQADDVIDEGHIVLHAIRRWLGDGGMASSMSPTLAQSLREVKRLMANGSKRRPFYDDDQAFIDAQKLTLGVLKEQMDEE